MIRLTSELAELSNRIPSKSLVYTSTNKHQIDFKGYNKLGIWSIGFKRNERTSEMYFVICIRPKHVEYFKEYMITHGVEPLILLDTVQYSTFKYDMSDTLKIIETLKKVYK